MDNVLDRIDEDEEQKSEECSGEALEAADDHRTTLHTYEADENTSNIQEI
jgi:hypothetical protein